MKKKLFIPFFFFLTPLFAFADVNNLHDLISQVQNLINDLIPLLFGIALLGFIWGVIKYIWAAGNADTIKKARSYIVFSIVAIAVMLSVWSLAFFLKDSFFPNAPSAFNQSGGNNPSNNPNSNVFGN